MIRKFAQPHRGPRFHSFLWGLGALLLAILAQRQLYDQQIERASVLFGVAVLLFVWSFRAQLRSALPVASRLGMGGVGLVNLLVRFLPGGLALASAYWSFRLFQANVQEPTMRAWWLHLVSLLLILLFAFLLDWRAPREPTAMTVADEEEQGAVGRWSWWSIASFIAIGLVALFMRLWQFDELPFGTWYDEAEAGLLALRILENANYRPIFEGSINMPAHYLYLITFFFRYVEISTQSIRLVSVVMGVAMVGAAYLVGRELFGGRLWGLALAFLVAVARWSVNFSRIGMYNISTPLFQLLTIGLLLRAFRRGRYVDYALAGLSLGLGLCFYVAFQLFVGVMLLFYLWMSLIQRGFLRRTWSGLLLVLVTAALVVMPLVVFANLKGDVYFARTNRTSIFADKTPLGELPPLLQQFCPQLSGEWSARCERLPMVLENARKHILMFNYRGDPNGRHNLPGEPMLDNIMAALLVLGVGLCLIRFWRPRTM